MKKVLFMAAVFTATANFAARADTFDFNFEGPDLSGMGTFTGMASSPGAYKITAITGSVTENNVGTFVITGLQNVLGNPDQMLYFPTTPAFDNRGLAFMISQGGFQFSSDGQQIEFNGLDPNFNFVDETLSSFVLIPDETSTTPAGAPAPLAGAGLLSFCGAGGLALRKRVKAKVSALLSRRLSAA